jgi:hypothetical protein
VEYTCVLLYVGVACCLLGNAIGREKNRPIEGFIWGFLFGPLGVMAMGFMPKAYSRKCPGCLLGIPEDATRCCHCGAVLAQPIPTQSPKQRRSEL